jgi:electron transfer flavoprotein beta subunit
MAEHAHGCVLVAMKWVPLRVEIDPLTGAQHVDDRFSGASPADLAALEWALRLGETRSQPVVAVTVGPAAADAMLRDAIAVGATRAVRVGDRGGESSETVARAIAAVARRERATSVLAGDWSLDRGSGSVPPLIADELDWPMACGLVSLSIGDDSTVSLERRLDGGRRERLQLSPGATAVLSVEGATARLRRAPLAGVVAARMAVIEHVAHGQLGVSATHAVSSAHVEPYRPRTRIHDGPSTTLDARRRVEILTGAFSDRTPPQRVELSPAAAAERIIEQLRAWGELK